MSDRYRNSEEMLQRALRSIPLGSQTFSKSKTQYPFGVSPYFLVKGEGSRVWDVDGNAYIDFVNGLASISLGYGDPDVTKAVRDQLENGVIFSLPHPLEIKVAEKIVEMVPCAEMVRFGKNGSDATSGAIRLARAYTGRDHVAVCGYHGWQDWYIATTARNRGIPQSVRELSHSFSYNDIDSLAALFRQWPDQIAAVILEPMNATEPGPSFLQDVQELCKRHGALLIFDETITGFRFAKGGAQELFGVVPDLATFGKAMANGYPVSAIAGRADVMKLMEEIFFSFTFGGETLSLAAALATMEKIQSAPVIETIKEQGRAVIAGVRQIVTRLGIQDLIEISGDPSWTFLHFKEVPPYSPWQIKTLFMQEVLARGILTTGTHNMSYAHDQRDVQRLLQVYEDVFGIIGEAVSRKKLETSLSCDPLVPLFRIR